MGRKKMRKRLFCLLGVIFIFIASVSPIVYAEENEQTKPAANTNVLTSSSDSWFVTSDGLKNYDTNDTSGNRQAKKVYFGQNNSNAQEWWIVGQDPVGEGLVLFAASPLGAVQQFHPGEDNQMKEYDKNCGCTYTGGDPSKVNPHHYGVSLLRQHLRNMTETNSTEYFSLAEKEMMKETIITTYDKFNSKYYTTEDTLYALHGKEYEENYITAGTNSATSVNDGLRIDNTYWGSDEFWLRTPYPPYGMSFVLTGWPKMGYVSIMATYKEGYAAMVPAFQLDLSSVLFASSAKAATSGGKLATSDTFTLRYKEDNNNSIGSVSVDTLTNTINVENAKSGAYLVVQNSNGAWAKSVKETESFNATNVDASLTSLEGCKVWLEYTNDRITTAAEPITVEKAPSPKVKVISQTASTITVTELSDQDKYGKAQYKLVDGSNATSGWKDSNVFDKLKANTDYTIYAKYSGKDNYLASEGSTTVSTSPATYNITIPKNVTAGDKDSAGEIAVNPMGTFDLGYKGQVYVKVSNNGAISNDGILTLTRQNDTSTEITSAMYVDGSPFEDITKDVAVFESINASPVTVSFKEPSASQGTVIPAGDYRATVTYEIKYRENP